MNTSQMNTVQIKKAFMSAVYNNNIETVKALIQAGADVNVKFSIFNLTPLHIASGSDSIEMVQVLIAAGANVNVQNIDGHTPLFYAIDNHNIEIIQILTDAGAVMPSERIPVDCMHVHTESHKFADKLPLIASILKEDLGKEIVYPSFINHIDSTIGKIIRESPLFRKLIFNKKPITREMWIDDYNKVKEILSYAEISMSKETIQFINIIIDFVIKYKLEECYIPSYVYDTAHAYEGDGRENEISCIPGGSERIYTTFFNCIKGMEEGVFGKINKILEGKITSWAELSKELQISYMSDWNKFVDEWAKNNLNNDEVRNMTPEQRNEAVMSAFKSNSRVKLPEFVEDHLRSELFSGLIKLWSDYGFNSENEGSHGGRRKIRYRKTIRKRKSMYKRKTIRKNKKSLKRR